MPYSIRFDEPPSAQNQPETKAPGQDNQPTNNIETIYVTMSRTDPEQHDRLPALVNGLVRCVAWCMLLVFVCVPDMPVYTVKTMVVPALLLPMRTITVSVPMQATGVTTYPATHAAGVLTITNGGSLTASLQAGFLLTASNGVEVSTDQSVTVPAGNGQQYGVATVNAYAVVAGSSGNIPAGSVNKTYGTDVFIRNVSAFTGGKDVSSVHYTTEQDKQTALENARAFAEARQPHGLLLRTCIETATWQVSQVSFTLTCQPIFYHAPTGMQIVDVHVLGMSVVLTYRTLRNADT